MIRGRSLVIFLFVSCATSVFSATVSVTSDGSLACSAFADNTETFVHIPKTVNHVTFGSGCTYTGTRVVFQLDVRRSNRHNPAPRLLIEMLGATAVPGTTINPSFLIDGNFTDFVSDVEFVGDGYDITGALEVLSVVGGPTTEIKDVTLVSRGTCRSVTGWGRLLSVVAGTVHRAHIKVGDALDVDHQAADNHWSDSMVASIRADHVECSEIRVDCVGTLVIDRSNGYTGGLTDVVVASLAGITPLSGSTITGSSVTIYFSVVASPQLSVHQSGLVSGQLGIAALGGVAALGRPGETAKVKISHLRIVHSGTATEIASEGMSNAIAVFGVAVSGPAGAEIVCPDVIINGMYFTGAWTTTFKVTNNLQFTPMSVYGIAAVAQDGTSTIDVMRAEIIVAAETTMPPAIYVHDNQGGEISAMAVGGIAVHSKAGFMPTSNSITADDAAIVSYGRVAAVQNTNQGYTPSLVLYPSIAIFGITCAALAGFANSNCHVSAARAVISLSLPSFAFPTTHGVNLVVDYGGVVAFGGIASWGIATIPIVTPTMTVSAPDITMLCASSIGANLGNFQYDHGLMASMGIAVSSYGVSPMNKVEAPNAVIFVKDKFQVQANPGTNAADFSVAFVGVICSAIGGVATSCLVDMDSSTVMLHTAETFIFYAAGGPKSRTVALAGMACKAATSDVGTCTVKADNSVISLDGNVNMQVQSVTSTGSITLTGIASLALGTSVSSTSIINANNLQIFTTNSAPSPQQLKFFSAGSQHAAASVGLASASFGGTGATVSRIIADGLRIDVRARLSKVRPVGQSHYAAAAGGVASLAEGDLPTSDVQVNDAVIVADGQSASTDVTVELDLTSGTEYVAGAALGIVSMAAVNAGGTGEASVLAQRAKLAAYKHVTAVSKTRPNHVTVAVLGVAAGTLENGGAATRTTTVDTVDSVIEILADAGTTVNADTSSWAGGEVGVVVAGGIAADGGTVVFDASGRTLRVCGVGVTLPYHSGQTVVNGTLPSSTGTDNSWVSTGDNCPSASMAIGTIPADPIVTYKELNMDNALPGVLNCEVTATPTDSASPSVSDSSSLTLPPTPSSTISSTIPPTPTQTFPPTASPTGTIPPTSSIAVTASRGKSITTTQKMGAPITSAPSGPPTTGSPASGAQGVAVVLLSGPVGGLLTVGVEETLTLQLSMSRNVAAHLGGISTVQAMGLTLTGTAPAIVTVTSTSGTPSPISVVYDSNASVTSIIVTVVVKIEVPGNCSCAPSFTTVLSCNATGMFVSSGPLGPLNLPMPSGAGFATIPIGSFPVHFAPSPFISILRQSSVMVELQVFNGDVGARALVDVVVSVEFPYAQIPLRIQNISAKVLTRSGDSRRMNSSSTSLASCTVNVNSAACIFSILLADETAVVPITLHDVPQYYRGRIYFIGTATPSNADAVSSRVFWVAGNATDTSLTPVLPNATSHALNASLVPVLGRSGATTRSIFESEEWFDIWFVFYTLAVCITIVVICFGYRHAQCGKCPPSRDFSQPIWKFVISQHVWLSVLLPCDYRCAVYHWTSMFVTIFGLYTALPMVNSAANVLSSTGDRRAVAIILGSFFAMVPRLIVDAVFNGFGVKKDAQLTPAELSAARLQGLQLREAGSEQILQPVKTGSAERMGSADGKVRSEALVESGAAIEVVDSVSDQEDEEEKDATTSKETKQQPTATVIEEDVVVVGPEKAAVENAKAENGSIGEEEKGSGDSIDSSFTPRQAALNHETAKAKASSGISFVTVASYRKLGWLVTVITFFCLASSTIALVWDHTEADRREYWITFGWSVLFVGLAIDPLRLMGICTFRWIKDNTFDDEDTESPQDGLVSSCGSTLRWFHPNEFDSVELVPWFH